VHVEQDPRAPQSREHGREDKEVRQGVDLHDIVAVTRIQQSEAPQTPCERRPVLDKVGGALVRECATQGQPMDAHTVDRLSGWPAGGVLQAHHVDLVSGVG
jgi:hypothetical protein